jgi:hypothetical protein
MRTRWEPAGQPVAAAFAVGQDAWQRIGICGLPNAGLLGTVVDQSIAGGGQAGPGTALRGVWSGLAVVAVERRAGVISKAWGEGLMRNMVRQLKGRGVIKRLVAYGLAD